MENLVPEGESSACRTPKKLQFMALEHIVTLILKELFPCSMETLWSGHGDGAGPLAYDIPGTYSKTVISEPCERFRDARLLDEVLMCREEQKSYLMPYKMRLLEKLHQVSQWLNKNDLLGSPHNHIRKQIRNAMTERLELIDPYSYIPLFKFLLELLFASKAGGCADAAQFPFIPKVSCELWRKDCPRFADVLRPYAPFLIEELSTFHIKFGDIQVLLVVIENSPFLKRVHLRNGICEDILMALEKNCPLLETFQMEKCLGGVLVPIDRLYKTFFCGKDYDAVMELAENSSLAERQNLLTFPSLNCINFGRMNDLDKPNKKESLSLFIYTLLHFYPHTMNVICGTLFAFEPALPAFLPNSLCNIMYNVSNFSVNGILKWNDSYHRNEIGNRIPIKHVHHLSLFHTTSGYTVSSVQKWIKFLKYLIPKIGCKIFSLYITLEGWPRVSTLPLYKSLFFEVGSSLSTLNFNIWGDIDLVTLCVILSHCPNLESLRVRFGKVHVSSKDALKIKQFSKLTSVTIHSSEKYAPLVHDFIEMLLSSSPELMSLSLVLLDQPYEWLMSLAQSKKLNGIRILRLAFHSFIFTRRDIEDFMDVENAGTSFYVYLTEVLTNLKILQLGSLPHSTFMQVKDIYKKSDLQLDIWHVPAECNEWYGGNPFKV